MRSFGFHYEYYDPCDDCGEDPDYCGYCCENQHHFYGYGLDFWFYDTGDEDSAWFPLASGNSYEVIEFKYIEFDRNNREITFYFYNGNDMYWSF